MFQAGKIMLMASAMSLAALPSAAHAADKEAAPISAASTADKDGKDGKSLYTPAVRAAVEKGVAQYMEKLGLNNLPPVDESRLPAARQLTATMSQRASIADLYGAIFNQFYAGYGDIFSKVKPEDLTITFGLSEAAAKKVTPDQIKAVAAILDPERGAREAQMKAALQPIANTALDVFVPLFQEGQARALTHRLTTEQLREVQQFLATPAGAAFARHWLPASGDREVMAAAIRAVPEFLPKVEGHLKPVFDSFTNMPKPKELTDLQDADLRKIAGILKTDFKTIKAAAVKETQRKAEDAKALEEASATDISAYDRENWSQAQRERVEALEAAATAAQEAVRNAETTAIEDASARLSSSRPPKSAQ